MKPKTVIASIIVSGLFTAGAALGVDTAVLPSVQKQGDVNYVSGGVGEDEATAFKQAAAQYPLEMLFVQKASPRDEYLADVRVSIRDRTGNSLLETTADGPYLLATLPAGKYRLEAEYRGEQRQQTVEIRPGRHQRAVFAWPARRDFEEPIASISSN